MTFAVESGVGAFTVPADRNWHWLAIPYGPGTLRLELAGEAGSSFERQLVTGLKGLVVDPFETPPRPLLIDTAIGIIPRLAVHMVGGCVNADWRAVKAKRDYCDVEVSVHGSLNLGIPQKTEQVSHADSLLPLEVVVRNDQMPAMATMEAGNRAG